MGKVLDFSISPEDSLMHHINQFLLHFLTRETNPLQKIVVELINEEPASMSEYAEAFEEQFEVRRNGKGILLFRKRW